MLRIALAVLVVLTWVSTTPAAWLASPPPSDAVERPVACQALGASLDFAEVEVAQDGEKKDDESKSAHAASVERCWGSIGARPHDPSLLLDAESRTTKWRKAGQGSCRAPPRA